MNKAVVITRGALIGGIAIWGCVFMALSMAGTGYFQVLNILGFLFLSLAPGMLTVLSLRLKPLPFFGILSLTVAFSLLELMIVGVLGNTILPHFGIARPLDQLVLIAEIMLLIAALSAVAWRRLAGWSIDVREKISSLFPTKLDAYLSFLPVLFVVQSMVGAFRLNNGSSGMWTLVMLGEIALYSLILFIFSKKIGDDTPPIALFFMSLSLLLMTSLRGWYITGHDIQQEYKVFELTKNAGIWSMAFFRDPYNACLSITILPTIFFNLLKASDPYIYKFIFQIFFAFCPSLAYLITRHWINKTISFLAGFYFLTFPTFFADMPFLVRQEIAFIFYGLMLYIIFEEKLGIKIRRLLFVSMGIGVVLSHYSTTYTTLFIFTLAVISRLIFVKLLQYLQEKWNFFAHSSLNGPSENRIAGSKGKITLMMVIILFAANFFWTSLVTNTGGHLTTVLRGTINAMKDGFTENNRSIDALTLVSFRKPSQQEAFHDYLAKVIAPIRAEAKPGAYYDATAYDQYNFTALPDEQVPLTKLGTLIQKSGIDFVGGIALFGRMLAKFMEILAPLGIVYILLRKSSSKCVDIEFYLLALYSLFFIFLNIVIPVLSTEYGIFRALQQSMFVLALPMVLGGIWMDALIGKVKLFLFRYCPKIAEMRLRNLLNAQNSAFSITLALLFFLYSTTFLPQVFGQTPAILFLNNAGRYYDNYLIKAAEVFAVDWLDRVISSDSDSTHGVNLYIQTDRYSRKKFASITTLDAYNDIFPGVVRKDAYVFLGQATAKKGRATFVYNSDQVTYVYPMQFLDDNKNLIYSNGSAKVYR